MDDARELALFGEPGQAIERLDALGSRDSKDAEIVYWLAVAQRRAGHTTRARESLRRAGELGWLRNDVLRQRYLIDFQSGQIKDAEPHLLEILANRCPDEVAAEIYECLVKGYLSDVRLHDAAMCMSYWLQWQPNSLQAHLLNAEVLDGVSDRNGMVAEYYKILSLDESQKLTRLRLAFTLLETKDVRGANEQFEMYLARWPEDVLALTGLGGCQRQLGRPTDARVTLRQALDGDLPDAQRGYALAELGQISMSERAYDEARDLFERALEASPSNSNTHYGLAMVLSRLGNKTAADEHLTQSRKLQSGAVRLEEVFDEVISRPEDADLRCEAGRLLLDQGKRQDAYTWLLSALRCERWHGPTHRLLARYYEEGGDAKMARQHLAWSAGNRSVGPNHEAN